LKECTEQEEREQVALYNQQRGSQRRIKAVARGGWFPQEKLKRKEETRLRRRGFFLNSMGEDSRSSAAAADPCKQGKEGQSKEIRGPKVAGGK